MYNLSPHTTYWVKTISKFVSVQLIVQALSVATGIIIVRVLSKEEYAYFTISNNINATLNILSNLGISSALLAIGSKVWQDHYRFGQLINTAVRLRYYFAAIAIVTCMPVMLWLLIRNGASIAYTGLLAIFVLIGLNAQLSAVVLRTIPRLHSKIERLQQLDLAQTLARLAVISISYFVFMNAAIAVMATAIAAGLENHLLRRWFTGNVDFSAPVNPEDRFEIIKIVKNHAPESIFYTFQGQIQIWIIGVFGSTQNIAEIGALSRLAIIFTIIGSLMTNIVVPSFSRYQIAALMRRRYLQIMGGLCLLSAFLLAIAFEFPSGLIWVLGKQYASLNNEVYLIIAASVFNSIVAIMWQMNAAKGWVDYAWLNIPLTIVLQILLLFFLDISTIRGVILFSLLSSIPWFIINILITYYRLFRFIEFE